MSSLRHIDRIKLERFFEMGSGYVCDFSDRTFGDFVLETTGIDVYTDEYAVNGTSKANRLRTFWKEQSNYLTAKLTGEMLEYWKSQKKISYEGFSKSDDELFKECLEIVDRIKNDVAIEDIDAFKPNAPDKNFATLSSSIQESIKKGEPSQALDRLHTFVVKYMRTLCKKHAIAYDQNTALHSLFGGYVKFLNEKKLIESEMSERILKSSISILEAFNFVRNNQSFAHDNKVLNHNESILIFNSISNILRFIEAVENKIAEEKTREETVTWDDIEFSEEEMDAAVDAYIDLEIDRRRGK